MGSWVPWELRDEVHLGETEGPFVLERGLD